MVQSSSSVNSARSTFNPVTKRHITEDLNPQEHPSTCLELGCMLRLAIHVLVLVCHLLLRPPQFITEICEYMSLLHSSTRHREVTRGSFCILPNLSASHVYCSFRRFATWHKGGVRNPGTV